MCKPRRLALWALAAVLCGCVAALTAVHWRSDRATVQWAVASPAALARRGEKMAVPALTGEVNVNTANVDELCALTGVGPALAQRIIDERETNGLFAYGEDLLAVKGIGQKTLDRLAGQYRLD